MRGKTVQRRSNLNQPNKISEDFTKELNELMKKQHTQEILIEELKRSNEKMFDKFDRTTHKFHEKMDSIKDTMSKNFKEMDDKITVNYLDIVKINTAQNVSDKIFGVFINSMPQIIMTAIAAFSLYFAVKQGMGL